MARKRNSLAWLLLCTVSKRRSDTVQLLGQIPDSKMPLLPKPNTQEEHGAVPVGLVLVLMLITHTPTKLVFPLPVLHATVKLASLTPFHPVFFHDKMFNSPEIKQ